MVKLINKDQKLQNERVKWIISGLVYDNLTDWEQDFIGSVEIQSDEGKVLTNKQMEILEKIYKEEKNERTN